ncbi:NERD domain-containing protein [Bacillus inaquosorum]|uniref:NERD domain-containing protein n=1 Tax=Bacillus inaquosorum TaxID=483913 RepID=UPI002280FDDF|nr:NERD domain-containing protein [Bacillus inaquosorum]MCY9067488.1 hypothetical protein [Bacillus inaquosorum]
MDNYEPNIQRLNTIDKRLRRYSLDSKLELLRVLYHATSPYLPNDDFLRSILPQSLLRKRVRGRVYNHELAYLSLAAIVKGEWNGQIEDIDFNALKKIIELYRDYNVPFSHKEDNDLSNEEMISQFSVRTGLQQFIFQRHPFRSFYRYNYFFNYINSNLNIKDIFISEFGYCYEDYLLFSWVLYVYSAKSTTFNLDGLIKNCVEILGFSEEKARRIVSTFSINRGDYQSLYKKFATEDANMRIYDFNPLLFKPILTYGSKSYFPMPFAIFIAVTEGLYQQLCTIKGLQFKSDFGKHAFEDYVEHILSLHEYDYIKEFEYEVNKNKLRSPDFILIKDNHIIFIELKARAPMISLRTTNRNKYIEELKKSYGSALAQCFKKESHIKKGFLKHPKIPQKISRVSHIAITLEEFNIVDGTGIEEAIAMQGARLSDSQYHIMSTTTLESILEEDDRDVFQYCLDREQAGTTNTHFSDVDVNRVKTKNNRNKNLMRDILRKTI